MATCGDKKGAFTLAKFRKRKNFVICKVHIRVVYKDKSRIRMVWCGGGEQTNKRKQKTKQKDNSIQIQFKILYCPLQS